MSYVMAVPGIQISWTKTLTKDALEDIKALGEAKGMRIKDDGMWIDEYEWFDWKPIEKDLKDIASYMRKKRIHSRGGLYLYFGKDKGDFIADNGSNKIHLSGGELKYSTGYIKPCKKVSRKKK